MLQFTEKNSNFAFSIHNLTKLQVTMKKYSLILLLALAYALSAEAASITATRAQELANEFLYGRQTRLASSTHTPTLMLAHEAKSADGVTDYYVFNRDNGQGFVIVSADDQALPVLGYSDKGAFTTENIPDNMRWWLGEYQRQIEWMRSHPTAQPRRATTLTTSVAPLLTTQWNQGLPYNLLCPEVEGNYSGRAWSGCVATAMAQIMKYHRWPAQGTGHHNYEWTAPDGNTLTLSAEFAQSHYQWADMADRYGRDYDNNIYAANGDEDWSLATQTQIDEVSRLMSDVGIALDMNYGGSGSGTPSANVLPALNVFFGYAPTMRLLLRDHDDYYDLGDSWDAILRAELDAGRPIYYSGSNNNSGHAFVFDGYDTNGYFHINWGWGGTSDGYFTTSSLNPNEQGAGSSEGGYNMGQTAVIGIEPTIESTPGVMRAGSITAMADVMPADDVRGYVDLEAFGGDYEGSLMMWVIDDYYNVYDYSFAQVSIAQNQRKRIVFNASIDANEGEQYYLALHNPYYENYGFIWGPVASFTVGPWSTPPVETGDVNGDSVVDIVDVNALINIILEKNDASEYPGDANIDGEGGVDVSDVNALINIILTK